MSWYQDGNAEYRLPFKQIHQLFHYPLLLIRIICYRLFHAIIIHFRQMLREELFVCFGTIGNFPRIHCKNKVYGGYSLEGLY